MGGGGGGRGKGREGELHKNVSQTLATIDFSSGKIAVKTLSVRKNSIYDINLG